MNALIIGSGGREHALASKIARSTLVKTVFVAPGNGGTEIEFNNLKIDPLDFESIGEAILNNKIELVIIGPEKPLVEGIIDHFENHPNSAFKKVHFIGPDKTCAQLEGSKDFSKRVMEEAGIPTARARSFLSSEWPQCQNYIQNHLLPIVIKADGLASGKGVAVCDTTTEALEFSKRILIDAEFGKGNQSLLVEEFLEGIEVSMFLLTDGIHYKMLPEAKDYKRIFDNDKGPNTGGMGSVSPVPFVDMAFTDKVEKRIIKPLFKRLKEMGLSYKGFLFIGLMNNQGEPSVIEFNARLGDPETQSILQRIDSDLVTAILTLKEQNLDKININFTEEAVTTIVLTSENYPENPIIGRKVEFVDKKIEGKLFHSGTQINPTGETITIGGRVFACTAMGKTLSNAIENAYKKIQEVSFEGMHYRSDIGLDILQL